MVSILKYILKFQEFVTEPGYDLLHVHDGTTSTTPYISGCLSYPITLLLGAHCFKYACFNQ